MESGRGYLRGEVAEMLGVGKESLRYYESACGLVSPKRGDNGYRRYDVDDVRRLAAVVGMLAGGMSTAEIGAFFGSNSLAANRELAVALMDRQAKEVARMQLALEGTRDEVGHMERVLKSVETGEPFGTCDYLAVSEGCVSEYPQLWSFVSACDEVVVQKDGACGFGERLLCAPRARFERQRVEWLPAATPLIREGKPVVSSFLALPGSDVLETVKSFISGNSLLGVMKGETAYLITSFYTAEGTYFELLYGVDS